MIMKFEHFEADLRRAVADPDTAKRFEEEQLTPFGDILDELSWWDERVEEMEKEERRKASARSAPQGSQPSLVAKPVVNPLGKVGRNDPCPCGSGRKFKKCCGR
jgi:preprotein translocase subunit SecA